MEDKRTAIAVLLCMFVLMFWMEMVMAPYNRRALPAGSGAPASTTPAAGTSTQSQPAGQNAVQPGGTAAPAVQKINPVNKPNPAEIKAAGSVIIESPLVHAEITNLGGRFSRYQLNNYKAHLEGTALLDMVSVSEGGSLPLAVYAGTLNDDHVKYTLEKTEGGGEIKDGKYILTEGQDIALHFTGDLNGTTKIIKSFYFSGKTYLFKIAVKLSAPTPDGTAVWVEWNRFNQHVEANGGLDLPYFAVLGTDNKVQLVQLTELTTPVMELGPRQWISHGDKYFMTTLIPAQPPSAARIAKDGNHFQSRMSGNAQGAEFNIYSGPKSHGDLQLIGYNLERNVDLGMFAFVAHPLLGGLKFFYSLLGNYGLAIILLTLVIKMAFLPLTKKSFESMKAMQTLQPEIKALRDRVQDPAKLNQEMMALYKKHNVNPMGGCLPMLIQLPVFLGLYNALNNAIELRHAPFALWINDLSSIERLEVFGIGVPVMVLLMGLSMFIQQWTTPSSADPQQKKIMMMMPVIFTISFVIFPFPSGLVLYWLVNNLISIVQQMYLAEHKKEDVYKATFLGAVGIFFFGYLLTLI